MSSQHKTRMASDCAMSNGHVTNDKNKIGRKDWSIKASPKAIGTVNPIRIIVEGLNLSPNPDKPFIPLSIGKARVVE